MSSLTKRSNASIWKHRINEKRPQISCSVFLLTVFSLPNQLSKQAVVSILKIENMHLQLLKYVLLFVHKRKYSEDLIITRLWHLWHQCDRLVNVCVPSLNTETNGRIRQASLNAVLQLTGWKFAIWILLELQLADSSWTKNAVIPCRILQCRAEILEKLIQFYGGDNC